MAEPRPSTDQESAPLLAGAGHDHDDDDEPQRKAFLGIYDASRPLTALERVLAVTALLLLLVSGTFIGLFAGTEHTLKKERKHHDNSPDHPTVTATTTEVTTTTVPVPGPTGGVPSKGVCTTPDCVLLSASILKGMNASVDPCDNFYQFALGGWLDSVTIPADRALAGSFYEVADNNKRIIKKIIEAIPEEEGDTLDAENENLQKLRRMYDSCMDVNTLNTVGLEPFLPLSDFVLESFGKFNLNPMPGDDAFVGGDDVTGAYTDDYVLPAELVKAAAEVEYYRNAKNRGSFGPAPTEHVSAESLVDLKTPEISKERRDKITKTLAFLHSRGVDSLVQFAIEGDAGGEDPQVQSLWLYQSFGGLPSKEYYEEAPIVDLYQSVVAGILQNIAETSDKDSFIKRDIVVDVAQELAEELAADVADGWPWPWPGDDKPQPGQSLEERMRKLAAQVVQFERKVVKAGTDFEFLMNPHYAYNPYSFDEVNDALGFLDLPTYLSTFAPRISPSNITVTYPPYLKAITKLVANVPDHVLSGYFVAKLALSYAPALGPEVGVRSEKRRLEEVLQGIKKGTEENRQDVCLRWVDNTVGYIAGREFVREAFSPEAKVDGEKIITDIVSAFHKKLPSIKWMDAESAAAAQKKAEAILPKVGYPLYPDTTKPESIKNWYSRLPIDRSDFFGNVLRSELLDNSRTWLTLGRQRNRDSWEMLPQTVNAYYSPPDGEIVFPAGILQPPFYHLSWPAYLRYGAFGAVAAHELTHAFDNSGAQYDEKGRLRDWWTNQTVAAFEERAQCVAKQYSKFYVLDPEGNKVYVNGNLTNGEDIADSGLAQAYAAWRAVTPDDKPFSLPGLDFTPEQLFFLSFARVWAQIARPATAVARVRTDPHSPPYWRAIGTLRNLPAFHEAFACKPGSGMNPLKKDQCELW